MDSLKHWERETSIYRKNTQSNVNDIWYHSIEGFEEFEHISSKILMETLFYKAIDPNLVCPKDSTGDTLLHRAAACGNVEGVGILLNQEGIHHKTKNNAGLRPQDIICTRINPHGSLAQYIRQNKLAFSTNVVKPEENILGTSEFMVCQDTNFHAFKQISDMLAEFKHFRGLKRGLLETHQKEKEKEEEGIQPTTNPNKKPRTTTSPDGGISGGI